MEVGAAAAARIAAKADHRAGRHIVILLHIATREVGVPGFQTILVPDDDQVAVPSRIVAGIADFTVERRIDRFADRQGNIHALMATSAPGSVFRKDLADGGCVKIFVTVDQFQVDDLRQFLELDVRIGENPIVDPMFPIYLFVGPLLQVGIVVAPRVVGEDHYLDIAVVRIERIDRPTGQVFEFGHRPLGRSSER